MLQGVGPVMRRTRTAWLAALGLIASVTVSGCFTTPRSADQSPPGLAITSTGFAWVDAVSTDARWLVGTQPRPEGHATPMPLVRVDRQTDEQTVLCDWADPQVGYCSLAEQGGMIEESPNLLLELIDDNAVRGWFPDGGVFLVDTSTGVRTRIDADDSGEPLRPAWTATSCQQGCDYHQAPRLEITTDAVSADGRVAAFCTNFERPREPQLYVKDLASGELARTGLPCGVVRFGRENDDDEFSDEGMSSPQVSADGAVVHVSGDWSTGGEYGYVGWGADTLHFPDTGQSRRLPGSGSMTRDGRTVLLRSGDQPEVAEAQVVAQYVAYDIDTGSSTPLPWLGAFLGEGGPAYVPDMFGQASDDGRLLLNRTAVHDVATGSEADIASLLRENGYQPTAEWGPMRITGDGATVLADVVAGDSHREDAGNAAVLVSGWGWDPMARATLTPVEQQTSLQVDIDPDDVDGAWTFQVERAVQDSISAPDWEPLAPTYTTVGPANRLIVDLPTGVYRVRVPSQHDHRGYLSAGEWIAAERTDR